MSFSLTVKTNIMMLVFLYNTATVFCAPLINNADYNITALIISGLNCFLQFVEVMFLICLAIGKIRNR
ncbi:ORF121 [Agrotis segetum granulovirus]|uniref:ORF121 n=1 Tax=Agrotis segetum granulosis virus TaxID=10464 RepID=Q6QXI1_GVAS|nr:hypothetical protein AsGV137 [Agrotis segetum granulovirus]AAS82617.1 ORF121 [Agrotis segetum granulovirus]AHN92173.1 hypothetical protein AsGV134 [Agrotis segetum granulovirus]AKN63412.1 hypothetical protein AsGV137 [Agrotis segetum granulovirus]